MESKPVETYYVHDYLRSKLCALYENDSIFDKFECCWSGDDSHVITGSYNNFFRTFGRARQSDVTYEASLDLCKLPAMYRQKKPSAGLIGRKRKEEIFAEHLDFSKKILHCAWHPAADIIALAATNNLYIFEGVPVTL